MADNTNRKQMQTNLSSNSNTIYLHGDHFDKTKAITCSLFAPPSPPHPPPGSLWVTQTDDITNSRYIQPVRSQQSWWCFTLLPLSLSLVSHSDAPLLCRLSLSLTHSHTHTVFLSRPHSSAPLQTWSMLSLAHGSSRRAINLMITWKSWVSVPCISISFFFCFFFNACTLRRGVCAHACETEDAAVVPVLQASACWDGFEASWMV